VTLKTWVSGDNLFMFASPQEESRIAAMLKTNQKTNQTRLWDSLMDMAKIGPGVAGGNNRQTLTDEDKQGRDLFATWCKAAGMTVRLTAWATCLPGARAPTKLCRR
jgi:hypothetical protein